jgi:hypothetical protein
MFYRHTFFACEIYAKTKAKKKFLQKFLENTKTKNLVSKLLVHKKNLTCSALLGMLFVGKIK